MTKQEFKDFCHEEFLKRGFVKKRAMYYLQGKEILCGFYLQKSMAEAFYVEYDFFLDYFDAKTYPTTYEADISWRISVLSKDTVNGEHFMDACIEYERYKKEEIKHYLDKEFDEHIIPIIQNGRERLMQDLEYYYEQMFDEEKEIILKKLSKLE